MSPDFAKFPGGLNCSEEDGSQGAQWPRETRVWDSTVGCLPGPGCPFSERFCCASLSCCTGNNDMPWTQQCPAWHPNGTASQGHACVWGKRAAHAFPASEAFHNPISFSPSDTTTHHQGEALILQERSLLCPAGCWGREAGGPKCVTMSLHTWPRVSSLVGDSTTITTQVQETHLTTAKSPPLQSSERATSQATCPCPLLWGHCPLVPISFPLATWAPLHWGAPWPQVTLH